MYRPPLLGATFCSSDCILIYSHQMVMSLQKLRISASTYSSSQYRQYRQYALRPSVPRVKSACLPRLSQASKTYQSPPPALKIYYQPITVSGGPLAILTTRVVNIVNILAPGMLTGNSQYGRSERQRRNGLAMIHRQRAGPGRVLGR